MSKPAFDGFPLITDKRQKSFSLILIFIVGILLVGIAHLLSDGFFRTVLTSIGSVVFAFGLTSVITQIFTPAPLDGVLRMINELLMVPWRSKEEDLIPLRDKFHGYLYTFVDGAPTWVYREFDFGNLELPGYLHASVHYNTQSVGELTYKYYGFPVQDRLLLIGRNAKLVNEPAVIQVIPKWGQSGRYAGLAFFENRSGNQVITPTIFSNRKLVDAESYGALDTSHSDALNQIWHKNFPSEILTPPSTTTDT